MRIIKSYVLRQGRMTDAQHLAVDNLLPVWGLAADQPWDFKTIFKREAPTIIEIGFGMGHSLFEMAVQYPEANFIGIEVHRPGVGALLSKINNAAITNLRVCVTDARLALEQAVPDASLARVQLFFPDPWPKARHHKRRIVQPEFVKLIERKLQTQGHFHIATDWVPYAESILEVMAPHTGLQNIAGAGSFSSRPDYRPLTKYEMRGQRLGHEVCDIIFEKRE